MTTSLITGASSGIGEAFARRLAGAGRDLFLVARSEDKLRSLCKELAEEHGIRADHAAIDLSSEGSDQKLFETTESRGLEVDLLINNAGFGSMGDFAELDLARELEMIRLNITALVALSHRYLAGMRMRRSGAVINVSSAAGFQPVPFMATYAATKAFVTSFSEAIAEENRPFGIQVLALCPGSTSTNFFEASNIDRALKIKGQQTADQVVDTALAALNGRRVKVVSGWTNYLVASATNLIPNSFITRVVGRGLRSRYQKEL
ncbi:MAG TPA: SDR family oxidoreductase [Pyrinomonadaceae bacterium]|nr:SDR family oxidoreductase [Pyrinomonadaceae bacterium]HMP65482.1 SDR family oxidoreductase [Pyrinomonadaceae bacterium]